MPDWRMPLKTGLNFLLLDLYVGFFSSWPIKIEIPVMWQNAARFITSPPTPEKKILNRSCNQNG